MNKSTNTASNYLKFLPAIFRGDSETSAFLGNYLNVFEKILSGFSSTLDTIDRYWDPALTPPEFVDWLAGCMGLALKQDWQTNQKRQIIATIVPIYRMRGTKRGLEEYLRIYVDGADVGIKEMANPFQIAVHSQIGVDSVIGLGRPYYFQISVKLPTPSLELKEKKKRSIIEIIDREKPAHTYYSLIIEIPTLQIAVASTVGRDTLLGGMIDS
jgi:phage tail-like protein